jgi:hypothetical protein
VKEKVRENKVVTAAEGGGKEKKEVGVYGEIKDVRGEKTGRCREKERGELRVVIEKAKSEGRKKRKF